MQEINCDSPLSQMRRIDTHTHVVPKFYNDWLKLKGIVFPIPDCIPEWTPELCLEFMKENGIESSILSVSAPGVHLGNTEEAKQMARKVNEYCYELVNSNPKSFGYFATLLLPDVANSIIEAKHALETLKADGVILLTNTGGKYLGDPEYEPLMEFLNEKKTTVFTHPAQLVEPVLKYISIFYAKSE